MKLTKKERADLAALASHIREVLLREIPDELWGAKLRRGVQLVEKLSTHEAPRD